MNIIQVGLGEREYNIYVDYSHLKRLPELLGQVLDYERILLVTNTTIADLYAEPVMKLIDIPGFAPEIFIIPDGEHYKETDTLNSIYDFLIENNFPRQSTILALGGGVVGDIGGFAAATYMRGINFVQIPTSYLAMVDASVGGKVAINHPLCKNLIGAFYQPKLVFINLEFLETLAEEELKAGFAEVIKYGIIRDASFFTYLEDNYTQIMKLAPEALRTTVTRSCEINP